MASLGNQLLALLGVAPARSLAMLVQSGEAKLWNPAGRLIAVTQRPAQIIPKRSTALCLGPKTGWDKSAEIDLCGRMLDSQNLRSMADQCRTLASTRQTPEATRALLRMAENYERQAGYREVLREAR